MLLADGDLFQLALNQRRAADPAVSAVRKTNTTSKARTAASAPIGSVHTLPAPVPGTHTQPAVLAPAGPAVEADA